jgi:hypothetical protein
MREFVIRIGEKKISKEKLKVKKKTSLKQL